VLAVLLVTAGNAWAGKYRVYSCRTPTGEAAPIDGWSGSTDGAGTHAENTCASGGALVAALDDGIRRTANTSIATWALELPTDETLAEATLWRAGDTAGGVGIYAGYQFWFAAPTETSIFDSCIAGSCAGQGTTSVPLSSENRVEVLSPHLGSHIYMNASCGGVGEYECPTGSGDEHGYAAVAYLYAANLVLEQSEGPSVKEVGGPLATESPVHGTSDLTFNATDPGAGVYKAVFTVDGHVAQETTINENSGRCKSVGTTEGISAFLYLQPCLKSVSADVGLETTKLTNGRHHIVVTVTDPAGNVAYALDREVEIFNPSGPIGYLWRVGETELKTGASKEFTAEVGHVYPLFRLVGKFDKTEVNLQSTQLKVSSAAITGGKPGTAKETLTLEDVAVSRPKKCEVSGKQIVTKALAGELVEATNESGTKSEGEALILGPASGAIFAEVEFSGSKCAYAGDVAVVEGSTLAYAEPKELKAIELGVYTKPTAKWYRNSKGERSDTELKIGSEAATLEGGLELTLVSKEAFGAF
jgi:hypothetical protein